MPESASGSEAHNSDIRNFIGKPQPSELLSSALKSTDAQQVPYDTSLMMYYLGMFVFAEAAFTLMAMKEYLQDLLHISERALIIVGYDPGAEKNEHAARIPGDALTSNWPQSEKAAE